MKIENNEMHAVQQAESMSNTSSYQEQENSQPLLPEILSQTSSLESSFPQELHENLRIVPVDSFEGKVFHEEMHKVLQRLDPQWNSETFPIQFLLSEDPHMVGFFYSKPDSDVSYIIIGKRAFEKSKDFPKPPVETIDELAALIGHEYYHGIQTLCDRNRRSSPLEEILADIDPIDRLEVAGFAPEATKTLLEKLEKSEKKVIYDLFDNMSGPHLLATNRVRVAEGELSNQELKKGALKREQISIEENQAIISAVKEGRHISHLDKYCNAAEADTSKKVNGIINAIYADDKLYALRVSDITIAIKTLQIDLKTPEEIIAYHKLCDAILDLNLPEDKQKIATNKQPQYLYLSALSRVVNENKREILPIARLGNINSLIQDFVSAKIKDEIKKSAAALIDAVENEPFLAEHKDIVATITWNGFPLIEPSFPRNASSSDVDIFRDYQDEAPWKEHIKTAEESGLYNDIATVYCIFLGIKDIRLVEGQPLVDPKYMASYNYVGSKTRHTEIEAISLGKAYSMQLVSKGLLLPRFSFKEHLLSYYDNYINVRNAIKQEKRKSYISKQIAKYIATFNSACNTNEIIEYKQVIGKSARFENKLDPTKANAIDEMEIRTSLANYKKFYALHYTDLCFNIRNAELLKDEFDKYANDPAKRDAIRAFYIPEPENPNSGMFRHYCVIGEGVEKCFELDTNPYLQFLLQCSTELISNKEKLQIIKNRFDFEYDSEGDLKYDDHNILYEKGGDRDENGIKVESKSLLPTDQKQIFSLVSPILKDVLKEFPKKETFSSWKQAISLCEQAKSLDCENAVFFISLKMTELANKRSPTIKEYCTLVDLMNTTDLLTLNTVLRKKFPVAAFNKEIQKYSLEKAVQTWDKLREQNLIPPASTYEMVTSLLDRIELENDLELKKQYLESFLGKHEIVNFTLKDRIVNIYTNTLVKLWGKDDASNEYLMHVSEVEKIKGKINEVDILLI